MNKPINILFTSVGRRVALLRMFRQAYKQLGLAGRIVAVDRSPLAAALKVADVQHVVPAIKHDEYNNSLLEIVRREQISAVFPLIDPDIPVLAEMRPLLQELGASTATIDHAMISKAADKWETAKFLRDLQVPTPSSWLTEELDADVADFPLFLKPRFGSASGDCFKLTNEEELRFFTQYVSAPIIQEFLPGSEITNDVICDPRGNVLDVVSRRRVQVRGGEVSIGEMVYDAEIAETCIRIAQALGATGPITIQCILIEGQPRFTEINPRLGGGAPCGVQAGANWPQLLLASIAGQTVEPARRPSYRTQVVFTRHEESSLVESPKTNVPKDELPSTGTPASTSLVREDLVREDSTHDHQRGARTKHVNVIGCGGHAKVVVSMLRELGYKVNAIVDDNDALWGERFFGIRVDGPIERIRDLPGLPTVIAVGHNATRRELASQLDLEWLTAVHPSAHVDASARLGAGCVVMAGTVIQTDACIGRHGIVNTCASVDHDCLLGDFVHVAPRSVLAGNVTLGEGVLFGVGASSKPGVHVGSWTTVGAGAAVVRDLPAGITAIGVPARFDAPSETAFESAPDRVGAAADRDEHH